MAKPKAIWVISLLGVVFIISGDTGEGLDFEVKCNHCFECRVLKMGHTKWQGQKLEKSMKMNVP